MGLSCGAAKAVINPPLGTLLSGYMVERPSTGIHDSLFARVLYIQTDGTQVLLVSLDLVAVDFMYVKNLREKLNEKFFIPVNNIFIHATHTHSGPGGVIHESSPVWKAFSNIWQPFNDSLIKDQYAQILFATGEAIANAEECTLLYTEGEVNGIGANRISPEREYQPKLQVVEFCKASGKKIVLYNYACHPTILHADNLLISADYSGSASKILENTEEIEVALFFNGPCGDISTRFTRVESTFAEVNRMGTLLAGEVKLALEKSREYPVYHLKGENVLFELSVRKMADKEELKAELNALKETLNKAKDSQLSIGETRRIESKIEGLTGALQLSSNLQGIKTMQTEIQILRLGDICFASFPGEAFFETGKEIRDSIQNSTQPLFLVGNTNDYIGYIVPDHYYEEGNYESSMTLLEKGSAEKIRDLLINHIGGDLHVSH
jgi:neutral ceramidase